MNEPLFSMIVDSLSDALVTLDQDKRIVNWNRQAESMFGYTRAEIEEAGIEAIIPESLREQHRESYEEFLRTIPSRESFVSQVKSLKGLRKDGEVFPVEITHSLLKKSDGRFFITAVIRDVTLSRQYQTMRKRVERITRHDVRNKLVIIALAGKKLAEALRALEDANCSKYMDIIDKESQSALDMLDSTRDLILLEAGSYESSNECLEIASLVRQKVDEMGPVAASREVDIRFSCQEDLEKIELSGDGPLVERALENLVKNAIEAENPGGTVGVALRNDEKGTPVLEIRNGGAPIPDELKETIYEPDVTHGKQGGSGLGLYATRLILEKVHPWKLSFRSGEEGTVFQVRFASPDEE